MIESKEPNVSSIQPSYFYIKILDTKQKPIEGKEFIVTVEGNEENMKTDGAGLLKVLESKNEIKLSLTEDEPTRLGLIDQTLSPLPSQKLCNPKWTKKPNPIYGKGALGERLDHMFYRGNDKEELVIIAQNMLKTLRYDLGGVGSSRDCVDGKDGKYRKKTVEAVQDFQGNNIGWDGKQLQVDGLIGPQTSDALNMAMVDKWYEKYQTPEELVNGKLYFTVTTKFLMEEGLLVKSTNEKEARVILISSNSHMC
jgi:hypothetical protein